MLLFLFFVLFLHLLHLISVVDSKIRRYSFVTQFDAPASEELALLHYRSLLSSHERYKDGAADEGEHGLTGHCSSCITYHACITGELNAKTRSTLEGFRVSIHNLHNISHNFLLRSSYNDDQLHKYSKSHDEWKNLVCLAQVSDHYFLQGHLDVTVILLGAHFLVLRDLTKQGALLSTLATTDDDFFYCVRRNGYGSRNGGMCEMDILSISSRLGTKFYAALNATSIQENISAASALQNAVSAISRGMIFLHIPSGETTTIVRPHQAWYSYQSYIMVNLLQVDTINGVGKLGHMGEHLVSTNDCMLFITIMWADTFNTAVVISSIMEALDHSTVSGCNDLLLATNQEMTRCHCTKDENLNEVSYVPKVFDSFMFNDELELLKLRLEMMEDLVDYHILVEARQTFRGVWVAPPLMQGRSHCLAGAKPPT